MGSHFFFEENGWVQRVWLRMFHFSPRYLSIPGGLFVFVFWIQYWVTPKIEVETFTNTGIGCCLHFLCRGWSLVSWTLCSLQLVGYKVGGVWGSVSNKKSLSLMVVQSPFVSVVAVSELQSGEALLAIQFFVAWFGKLVSSLGRVAVFF